MIKTFRNQTGPGPVDQDDRTWIIDAQFFRGPEFKGTLNTQGIFLIGQQNLLLFINKIKNFWIKRTKSHKS